MGSYFSDLKQHAAKVTVNEYFGALRGRKGTKQNAAENDSEQHAKAAEQEFEHLLEGVLDKLMMKWLFTDRLKRDLRPVKGVDYFTPAEIDEHLARVTPKKGEHYFDGAPGEKGDPGRDGKDADEDSIVRRVLAKLPPPEKGAPGRDGRDGKDADIETLRDILREDLASFFGSRKLALGDVVGLEEELSKRPLASAKHGGQGKTNTLIVGTDLTTADSQTYTFLAPPLESELEIYRGGARLFKENGDYTVTVAAGGRIQSIALSSPLSAGESLNVRSRG